MTRLLRAETMATQHYPITAQSNSQRQGVHAFLLHKNLCIDFPLKIEQRLRY